MTEAVVASMIGGALIFAVGVLTGSSLTLKIAGGLARYFASVKTSEKEVVDAERQRSNTQ